MARPAPAHLFPRMGNLNLQKMHRLPPLQPNSSNQRLCGIFVPLPWDELREKLSFALLNLTQRQWKWAKKRLVFIFFPPNLGGFAGVVGATQHNGRVGGCVQDAAEGRRSPGTRCVLRERMLRRVSHLPDKCPNYRAR